MEKELSQRFSMNNDNGKLIFYIYVREIMGIAN